jgi:peptidoglycan/xylan/chitin deacetylase (PgdA/CDA1 family)
MRVKATLVALSASAAALFGAVASDPAGAAPRDRDEPARGSATALPLAVAATTVRQEGQDLVWRVELQKPFAPARLALDHRSLCLLLERSDGSVAGHACILGPARHARAPRMEYAPITAAGVGRAAVIDATITRDSSRELEASFLPAAVGEQYRPLRWQVISTLRPPACEPPVPSRAGCYTLFPDRGALLRLHVPVAVGCVPAGSSEVFDGPSATRTVALTFDDGPWNDPSAGAFLDVLEREHAVATFFEIGDQIASYDPRGTLERRMLADGDFIGDHTWTHPQMTYLSSGQQRQQLLSTAEAISRATGGLKTCLWRPPYGAVNPSLVTLARSLGMLTIMWDVDTRDWSLPGTATIYARAVDGAHDGAIAVRDAGGASAGDHHAAPARLLVRDDPAAARPAGDLPLSSAPPATRPTWRLGPAAPATGADRRAHAERGRGAASAGPAPSRALIHTAAASNLGQMLVRICAAGGVGLVNIVRRSEQAQLLREIGAVHVVDSSRPDFVVELTEAVRATNATIAFDAIGGGALAGEILTAIERAQPPSLRAAAPGRST